MDFLVYGSLAYDRIMNFNGRFSDHIMPDKIHILNVSFNVSGLKEMRGGTAGNIAYGLTQLGERPKVLGALGKDGDRYLDWMREQGMDVSKVRVVEEEYTAGCFLTTDLADNQINGFNPGAMYFPCHIESDEINAKDSLAIVAPGGMDDMTRLPSLYRQLGVPFIFDPGQSLNIWNGEDLKNTMQGAKVLISNDYELEMIKRMTGLTEESLLEMVESIVTTKGEQGSVVKRNGTTIDIPVAPADEVKDPTGAGDAYRAGMLKGLSMGLSLEESCLWGSAISSFAVACYGTQEYTLDQGRFQERLSLAKDRAEF